MNIEKVNREYIELIQNKPGNYREDYVLTNEKGAKSNAVYKGKPVPFLYHPMFISESDMDSFKKICNTMMSISNKLTNRYIEDKDFRQEFGFPKLIEELIEVDNGYDINIPIGRFDIFYKDIDNFKFCELNTDGSSAMNEDNTISKILLETEALNDFGKKYNLEYFELFDTWVEESIKIYRRWNPDLIKPNVAILDFNESGTPAEFEEFMRAFVRNGYYCIIADPRDLEYRDGALYKGDYKIDMVYRRIVTFEIAEKADQIPDFIQAYKDRAFCCIGSVKSQIIHNKVFFKILHDEDTLKLLTEEEREFVKKHIPITGLFKGDSSVFNKVLNDKEKYILKPLDLNASQGVFTGRDLSQEDWEKRLKESWNKDYLYQEYFDPFTREFIVYRNGKPEVEEFKSMIGMFVYNEKFAGLYTRIGKFNIIAESIDPENYNTLPNILVKKK